MARSSRIKRYGELPASNQLQPTPMNKGLITPKLSVRCEFRSSGYSQEEISELRSDLSEIAPLQARRLGIPAAGASYDIWFIINWTGVAVLTGVIGNAAHDLIKLLGARLVAFWQRKQENHPYKLPPDVYYLKFQFEDVDIRIHPTPLENDDDSNFLSFSTLLRLHDILSVAIEHLQTGPLSATDVQAVDIYEPHSTLSSNHCRGLLFTRPWRIEGIVQCSYSYYFPHERRLQEDAPN